MTTFSAARHRWHARLGGSGDVMVGKPPGPPTNNVGAPWATTYRPTLQKGWGTRKISEKADSSGLLFSAKAWLGTAALGMTTSWHRQRKTERFFPRVHKLPDGKWGMDVVTSRRYGRIDSCFVGFVASRRIGQ